MLARCVARTIRAPGAAGTRRAPNSTFPPALRIASRVSDEYVQSCAAEVEHSTSPDKSIRAKVQRVTPAAKQNANDSRSVYTVDAKGWVRITSTDERGCQKVGSQEGKIQSVTTPCGEVDVLEGNSDDEGTKDEHLRRAWLVQPFRGKRSDQSEIQRRIAKFAKLDLRPQTNEQASGEDTHLVAAEREQVSGLGNSLHVKLERAMHAASQMEESVASAVGIDPKSGGCVSRAKRQREESSIERKEVLPMSAEMMERGTMPVKKIDDSGSERTREKRERMMPNRSHIPESASEGEIGRRIEGILGLNVNSARRERAINYSRLPGAAESEQASSATEASHSTLEQETQEAKLKSEQLVSEEVMGFENGRRMARKDEHQRRPSSLEQDGMRHKKVEGRLRLRKTRPWLASERMTDIQIEKGSHSTGLVDIGAVQQRIESIVDTLSVEELEEENFKQTNVSQSSPRAQESRVLSNAPHGKDTPTLEDEVIWLPGGSKTTVGRLASVLSVSLSSVLAALEQLGEKVTPQTTKKKSAKITLDDDTAELVALELGRQLRFRHYKQSNHETSDEVSDDEASTRSLRALSAQYLAARESLLPMRPSPESNEWASLPLRHPIVAVMGHVDHGKTTLLDALRGGSSAAAEAGGITQRLAAFELGNVTFIDTPGHAAFSSMRSSSAKALDVALIVVAADDGVKPQTIEAVKLARDRKAAIVFALTKVDRLSAVALEDASKRVSEQLAQAGIPTEADGGDSPLVMVSAPTGYGLDTLRETLEAHAEVLDLRADPNSRAEAVVADSVADKRLGLCLDVLVLWGSLKVGEHFVVGNAFGKVRRLASNDNRTLKVAKPSSPARVIARIDFAGGGKQQQGLDAGEMLLVVEDDKAAKRLAASRAAYLDAKAIADTNRAVTAMRARAETDGNVLHDGNGTGDAESQPTLVPLVVKVESSGEVDAVSALLASIPSTKVRFEAVGGISVGAVGKADVDLAATLRAPIFAWSVGFATPDTKDYARKLGVDIRRHKIVYALLEDVKEHATSKLPLVPTPSVRAKLDVVKVIELNDGTKIAGCKVTDGTLKKTDPLRHLRNGVVRNVDQKGCASLKHFKDDVTILNKGADCGVGLHDVSMAGDLQEGDILEAFEIVHLRPNLDNQT